MILRIDGDSYPEGSGVTWEVQLVPDRVLYVRSTAAAGYPLARYAERCVAAYNAQESAESSGLPPEAHGVAEVVRLDGSVVFRFDVVFLAYRMTPRDETLRLEIVGVTQGGGAA